MKLAITFDWHKVAAVNQRFDIP